MPNYYLICEDFCRAAVGPFPTRRDAIEHMLFLDQRGDADTGYVATESDLPKIEPDETMTPQEDRDTIIDNPEAFFGG